MNAQPGLVEAGKSRGRSLSVSIRKCFSSGFDLQTEFEAAPGITILFGRSGSGKTTVLQCVAGLLEPDGGKVRISGRVLFDRHTRTNIPVVQRRMGYVFQNLALFPHLTAEENVAYGLGHLAPEQRRQRVGAMLELFRIGHLARRRPRKLSGGEQQRVALARSLAMEPEALLLDEPLSALDAPTQSALIEDLRRWNRAHGIPILYVTHSQREAFALGEHVVVLEQGRVIAEGGPQEVLRAPHQETVAQLAGFENIFESQVISAHEEHGTMTCRLKDSDVELEVPRAQVMPGSSIRIAVNAGDILVANQRPQGLSARNLLQGTLLSLDQQGITINARVDCGALFHVKLTPSARNSLGLEPGREVWLVIKTYSCHLLENP